MFGLALEVSLPFSFVCIRSRLRKPRHIFRIMPGLLLSWFVLVCLQTLPVCQQCHSSAGFAWISRAFSPSIPELTHCHRKMGGFHRLRNCSNQPASFRIISGFCRNAGMFCESLRELPENESNSGFFAMFRAFLVVV